MAVSTLPSSPLPTGNEREIETVSLFDKSVTVTFLEPPPTLNASVLIRTTYHSASHESRHPLIQSSGKAHPHTPRYHLHFSQSESFVVLQGQVGTTTGYDVKDSIWTRANTVEAGKLVQIPRLVPHTLWPAPKDYEQQLQQPQQGTEARQESRGKEAVGPEEDEDTVTLSWAHPHIRTSIGDGGISGPEGYLGGDMDYVFFRSMLLLTSDIYEGKAKERAGLSSFGSWAAIQALQTASDSTFVVAPGYGWLGPLRWYVPLFVQKFATIVWTNCGGRPDGLVEAYVPSAYWHRLQAKKDR